MIRNYNADLILALFGHGGHCITFANVSLQFKRHYFNIAQNLTIHNVHIFFNVQYIDNYNSHKHHHYSSYSNITQYYSNFLSISLLS